jgi:hypothetical protein
MFREGHSSQNSRISHQEAQEFFDKIKHGDDEHREWLAVEFEKFFNMKIRR